MLLILLLLRGRGDSEANIDAPGDAVELDVESGYLAIDNLEKVEAFDWLFAGADTGEVPVPHDLVASVKNVKSVLAFDARGAKQAIDIALLALESDTTKL